MKGGSDPSGEGRPARPGLGPTLLPLPYLCVLVGGLLAAYGALSRLLPDLLTGLVLLVLGAALYLWEGRWTRAWILPPGTPPRPGGPTPWWKRPLSYHGRWMCTNCGWREETWTTFCPRCGKPLVQLPSRPAPPTTKS